MDMKDFRLDGKVALVTGASYGIGFAIATGLAAAGATIVFNDIKQELVDKGIEAYKEEGIKAYGYVCDVTNEDAVNEMAAKIEKEVGVVDILVIREFTSLSAYSRSSFSFLFWDSLFARLSPSECCSFFNVVNSI